MYGLLDHVRKKGALFVSIISITGVICLSIVINNESVLIEKDIIRKLI